MLLLLLVLLIAVAADVDDAAVCAAVCGSAITVAAADADGVCWFEHEYVCICIHMNDEQREGRLA